MKRTIARIAAATLTAAAMLGTTSVMAALPPWEDDSDFDYEGAWELELEGEKERRKHVVYPYDPRTILFDWKYAPCNPTNRSDFDMLSDAEKAELCEQSENMFFELHGYKLHELFDIEVGEMEQKLLYSGGAGAVKGDVNVDGKQNAKDVIAAMRIMLDIEGAPDLQFYLADINSDGNVNAKDVVGMMRAMLG